jgi:hypothetical protein
MFGLFKPKSNIDVIRSEAVSFLTKNLGLTKATAKAVSNSIDESAANYLIALTPNPGLVIKSLRKMVAAELAYKLNENQGDVLIKAIAEDIEYSLNFEMLELMARGQLSSTAYGNAIGLSAQISAYVSDRLPSEATL